MKRAALTIVALLLAACSSSAPNRSTSSGAPTSSAVVYDACTPPPSGSSSSTGSAARDAAASTGASSGAVAPQLTLTDIAKLDGAPTAVTTRCDEHALYLTLQSGSVVRVGLDARAEATTVLDITGRVHSGGEQGLLGLAFSPKGDQLYLAYTNTAQDQELDRFAVTPAGVDENSREMVLTIPDFAPNHNGGQLVFGRDGNLYWGMGDGGGANDSTKHTGQDPNDLLGDILRLDVLHPSGDKPYGIPPDNPFVKGGGAPEVWAYGLRNPWRFAFDPVTGDLWIADVGQNQYEEIDRVPPDRQSGANFGWSDMEGNALFNGAQHAVGIAPVYVYDHSHGECAVIGGYVYRGAKIPDLEGVYLYGDNCVPGVQGLRLDSHGNAVPVDIGLGVSGLSTFGQDIDGELYACSLDGTVVRIDGA